MKANPNLHYLQQVLLLDIPQPEQRELGFLDVVDHTTRETTICNVYKYFLDSELSPQISGLLISALESLIENELESIGIQKEMDLSEYDVILEFKTRKGRIDIVLDNKVAESAVIIEVKIYHGLHNDLNDYWQAFDYNPDKKIGIVLGLYPLDQSAIGNKEFISITHTQWLEKALERGLPHDLPVKDFIYFKDFVNNMKHLTQSNQMTPEVQFYLNHPEKIESAIATKNAAMQFVIDQLRTAAERLNLSVFGSNDNWRNLWDAEKKDPVYYTVFPHDIITSGGQNITIIIELFGAETIAKEDSLRQLLKGFKMADRLKNPNHRRSEYVHFLSTTIQLKPDSFDQLALKIVSTITNDLEPVRQKLLKALN